MIRVLCLLFTFKSLLSKLFPGRPLCNVMLLLHFSRDQFQVEKPSRNVIYKNILSGVVGSAAQMFRISKEAVKLVIYRKYNYNNKY